MGQELVITVGRRRFSRKIGHADWDALKELRKIAPTEVGVLIDVPLLEDDSFERVTALRSAAEKLLELAESDARVPATYEYASEFHPMPFNSGVFSSGVQGGIRLVGDDEFVYSLEAGMDKCFLKKIAINPDGTGTVVERRDIRGLTVLETKNEGKITIRATRKGTELTRTLRALVKFLRPFVDGEARKRIV